MSPYPSILILIYKREEQTLGVGGDVACRPSPSRPSLPFRKGINPYSLEGRAGQQAGALPSPLTKMMTDRGGQADLKPPLLTGNVCQWHGWVRAWVAWWPGEQLWGGDRRPQAGSWENYHSPSHLSPPTSLYTHFLTLPCPSMYVSILISIS